MTARSLIVCIVLACPALALGDRVDDWIRREMKARRLPGVSVAVVHKGKMAKMAGYGVADLEHRVPATADTVYELASVTKPFTAMAAMLLVQDGRVGLDDPIRNHLDGLPEAWTGVTIRHLLSHTPGIKSYTSLPEFLLTPRRDYAPQELVKLAAAAPVEFEPGERWAYCNTGYVLLGLLIEEASGRPWGAFLKERILDPLGMRATRANDRRAILPGRARGYALSEGRLANAEYLSTTQPYAAGALVSTVRDLARWDDALSRGRLLPRAVLREMWTPVRLRGGMEAGYGLGWSVERVKGRRRVGHGGGILGFSTQIDRWIDDALTVIVLTNLEGGGAERLARGIAGLYVPALAEAPARPTPDGDPKTTAAHRKALLALIAESPEGLPLTPQFRAFLTPEVLKQGAGPLRALGELRAFQVLNRQPENGVTVSRYRARFANGVVRVEVRVGADGLIAGLGVRPE